MKEHNQQDMIDAISQQMKKQPLTLNSSIAECLRGQPVIPQPDPRKSFGEWLYRIFRPCDHQWHTINVEKASKPLSDEPFDRMIVATVYHLRCKSCGDIKSRKVRV